MFREDEVGVMGYLLGTEGDDSSMGTRGGHMKVWSGTFREMRDAGRFRVVEENDIVIVDGTAIEKKGLTALRGSIVVWDDYEVVNVPAFEVVESMLIRISDIKERRFRISRIEGLIEVWETEELV